MREGFNDTKRGAGSREGKNGAAVLRGGKQRILFLCFGGVTNKFLPRVEAGNAPRLACYYGHYLARSAMREDEGKIVKASEGERFRMMLKKEA